MSLGVSGLRSQVSDPSGERTSVALEPCLSSWYVTGQDEPRVVVPSCGCSIIIPSAPNMARDTWMVSKQGKLLCSGQVEVCTFDCFRHTFGVCILVQTNREARSCMHARHAPPYALYRPSLKREDTIDFLLWMLGCPDRARAGYQGRQRPLVSESVSRLMDAGTVSYCMQTARLPPE